MRIGLLTQHAELLTAEPGNEVGLPLHTSEHAAELLQDPVACSVTVCVIDGLEVIEVRDNEG